MNSIEISNISRRRFFAVTGISAGAALLAKRTLLANEVGVVPTMINEAAIARISVIPLRRNISVLEGSGGNIAVLTGHDGKLLVDAGFAVSRPRISAALASIDSDPIKHLISSHWHADHTDGNAWMHSEGARITGHENTLKHLSVATRVDGWHYTFPAAPPGALPVEVFDAENRMQVNDTGIVCKHYAPAHTDSDISIYFEEADVLHVADTWWNGDYPFIDYWTGGSIDGSIRAAETNLAMATDKTIIIPGHGAVGNRSNVIEFRDMLVAIREKVASLKRQGRSMDETVAARPTTKYDPKWGQFLTTPAAFTALVYMGV